MRKFQTAFPAQKVELSKVGKITLGILLVILTVLVYARAEAKKNTPKSVFVKNDFLEELEKNAQDENRTQNKQLKNLSILDIKKASEENKLDRVLYNINPLFSKNLSQISQVPKKEAHEQLADELPKSNDQSEELEVDATLREDVSQELKGTRMEPMIDYIAAQDRETAALLVGIARIESGYSHNYSYNFWGYAGGYYGFKNPEQAVSVVGKRIQELQNQGLNTPAEIVYTWKCGGSCASHAPGSVQRWVYTASGPYNRIAMK